MYKKFFKRTLDLIISLFALIILCPILFIISIILFVSNKGSGIFFTQERPGKNGKLFKVIKFKSMTDEKDKNGILLENDKRITKIGKIIRKLSIDEIPQLFNVVKGDMSLIGPRPLLSRYMMLYNDEQKRRHEVRPGITGWAQINGRNNITWEEKFQMDIWYVDHYSFLLDLKIFFKTIQKTLKGSDVIIMSGSFKGNNKVNN